MQLVTLGQEGHKIKNPIKLIKLWFVFFRQKKKNVYEMNRKVETSNTEESRSSCRNGLKTRREKKWRNPKTRQKLKSECIFRYVKKALDMRPKK